MRKIPYKNVVFCMTCAAGLGTEPAAAVTAPPASLGLREPSSPLHQRRGSVVNLQKPAATNGSPEGFGLRSSARELLGRYGLSAREVLEKLAPHLKGLELKTARVQTSAEGRSVHESYDLYFGDYRLADTEFKIHHHDNQLVMIRARLPDYRLPEEPFTKEDFLPLASLGMTVAPHEVVQTTEKTVATSGGFPAPAWRIQRSNRYSGETRTLLVDAQTGAILEDRTIVFHATGRGRVFPESPAAGGLADKKLPGLLGTGFLDGRHFTVYAPKVDSPRVRRKDHDFAFDPKRDPEKFNQVQAYYHATRALTWYREHFGYEPGAAKISVHVNGLVQGRADNAQYRPPPDGPRILLGKGDRLKNLSRDQDVMVHELGHHVLYAFLPTYDGASGVLHEGYADYFAFAAAEDPQLGEGLTPDGKPLRNGKQPADVRLDNPKLRSWNTHEKGQVWSTFLWTLRKRIGPSFDQVVYDSLPYLGRAAGYKDALMALFNADRDHGPSGDGKAKAFGPHKCAIMQEAVARGFARQMKHLDGSSCGIDLAKKARKSHERLEEPAPEGPEFSFTLAGKKCSVIAGGSATRTVWAWLCLAAPLGMGMVWRRTMDRRRGRA